MKGKGFPDHLIGQVLQDKYPFTCPGCGHQAYAAPSIAMKMGSNKGWIVCPQCKSRLGLEINDDNTGMLASLEGQG